MPTQYMMSFPDALTSCFKKCTDYNGRASRAEFWWYQLLWAVGGGLVSFLFPDLWAATLLLWIPALAVGARRLHDIGRTGWWQLAYLTGIGALLMLFWGFFKSQPCVNKYGDVPCVR